MRATRAYIASFGTTGVLLASSLALLVVVSALFAFNGWPGSDPADEAESVLVEEDEPFRVSGPTQVALDAASASVAVAAAPTPGTAAALTEARTRFTTDTGDGDGGVVIDRGGAPDLPDIDGGPGGRTPPTRGPGSVDPAGLTQQAADTIEGATRNLGDTGARVNPELGRGVSDTGRALSDIVRNLPDRVDPQRLP